MLRSPTIKACGAVAFLAAFALLPATIPAAEPANDATFVRVSPRDPRYFELSDGRPYVPIGLNLIAPPRDDVEGQRRWMEKLSANGGNYIRVWLGHPFFDVEHEKSGQYDEKKAQRIEQMLATAARNGIRVKMCLESFRHLGEGRQTWAGKPLHHVDHGGPARSTAEFFTTDACRDQFKRKLDWYAGRYGDCPTVFAWELWNEMNCITGGDWAEWTDVMLPELHRRFPKNLATQSLGSFDRDVARKGYRRLCEMPDNDLLQVHRYLDLGAQLDACRGPVDELAADAVGEILAFGIRKPVMLAESGAVEPRHSGPFKLYEKDTAGILLHDVLFAPFFCGAAGPGHIWHWEVYVDRNNLWHHFARFARAIEGIDPPAEVFQSIRPKHPALRVYALQGKNTLLVWCRDPQNTWQTELAEGRAPRTVENESLSLDLPTGWIKPTVSIYDPWTDEKTKGTIADGKIALPPFSRSVVVRVTR